MFLQFAMANLSYHIGPPHHWVTPFLGKRGQIGLSRHNFASTAPFPDLSTHWLAYISPVLMAVLKSKLVR